MTGQMSPIGEDFQSRSAGPEYLQHSDKLTITAIGSRNG
jgi:hypothetical protein